MGQLLHGSARTRAVVRRAYRIVRESKSFGHASRREPEDNRKVAEALFGGRSA